MECGVDSVEGELGVREVGVDGTTENGDPQGGFGDSDEDGLMDLGENEVFVEAMEPPSPLPRHAVPDSHNGASSGADDGSVCKKEEALGSTDLTMCGRSNEEAAAAVGMEEEEIVSCEDEEQVDEEIFDDSIDAVFPDQVPEEQDGAVDAEIDGRGHEVVETVIGVSMASQHINQNIEEQIAVGSKEGIAVSGESDLAVGERKNEDYSMHSKLNPVVSNNEGGGDGTLKVGNGSSVVADERALSFSHKSDPAIYSQHDDQSVEEQRAFESVEGFSANDKSDLACVEAKFEYDYMYNKPNLLASDSVHAHKIIEVALQSSVVADELIDGGHKESIVKKPQDEKVEKVKLDEPADLLRGSPKNTVPLEVSSDSYETGHDVGSNRQIPDRDRTKQRENISGQSLAISKEQEKMHKQEENAELVNYYATNAHASVEKEDSGIANSGQASLEKDALSSSYAAIAAKAYVEEDKADSQDYSTKEPQKKSADSRLNTQSARVSPSNSEISRGPSLSSCPAGLGSSSPLLEQPSRPLQQPRTNGSASRRVALPSDELPTDDGEENDETREKLQIIRVKFLRLAHRLGQTPHNVVVAQVLYRLGLAEQLKRNTNRTGVFSFDRASVIAEQLEAVARETLDFSCTIMVIGKTGVGKSATINSIFDEVKLPTDAFQLGTKKVHEVVGMVQGIKVRVIDTPGLCSSSSDQYRNDKILRSVKKFISKSPPDIVLYFDRLDMQSRDYGDALLLRTITDILGASIWFNAIVVLTHAASAPPDGLTGNPLSYEMFVTQRTHVVQQAIRQAAGDVRLMNPVSLVENHSACRINRAGQRVLPNGQVWKPLLLLLSFASKILAEANMLLNLQDGPPGKPFGSRPRVLPLPFLLSSLLQSRTQPKMPEDQSGDVNLDEDSDEASDSDEGSDIDELPSFKPLTKSQITKLSKAQKKAYFEELDYRERLLHKKQLKEEKRRRKFAKKMADMAKDMPSDSNNRDIDEESSAPTSVPVPLPDFVLPNSFDSDNPSHRYRFLDSFSPWLIRPVLDSQGWDHDIGYEGLNAERVFVVKDKIPLSVSGQLTKDKKECTFQMELASSMKHSESKATSLCLDMQTVGTDIAYTLRGETRFRKFGRNNTVAGVSVTALGDSTSAGIKLEDKLVVSKGLRLLISGGAMSGRGDVAYGGRLEATLRDKDYPIGQALSTFALSIVDWHGDLSLGCNVQSQLPLGRGTNIIGHANLSNKGTGQIGIRLNSSEHLQIVLLALVPIFRNVQRMLFGSSHST